MECLTSENWMRELGAGDRVLLINPPVQEVRYAWVRWNQPSDLLLLSSKLKNEVGCEVELLDFMLPTESGRVSTRDQGIVKTVGSDQMRYKVRTYGMQLEEAKKALISMLTRWVPTHVVITSLTSYWYEALITLLPVLRGILRNVKFSLIGAYPVIETEHAKRLRPNYIVTDFFTFDNYLPDYELYFQDVTKALHSGTVIGFGGLKFTKNNTAQNLIQQVQTLKKHNIRNCVILESNLFVDGCTVLEEFLHNVEEENLKINLHGLCGLEISDAVDGIYSKMQKGGYRSFFLEYDRVGDELNLDSYRRAYHELVRNPQGRITSGDLAGFLMIGMPDDDLERMFKHCFNLLEICGSIIPKPYTPSPGTEEYSTLAKQRLDLLTPHAFPMAETTGITREEYMDFYKHTTFLNEKRMGMSFNFFDETYSSIALKRSLGKKGGFL